MTRVLIVDDDPIACDSMSDVLTRAGYGVATTLNSDEAIEALREAERHADDESKRFDVLLMDFNLAGVDGLDFLRRIKRDHPNLVVVIVTAYGTIESAVNAIKSGAFDYLTHPIVEEELAMVIGRAAQQGALLAQNVRLRRQLDERFGLDSIVGGDPRMLKIYDLVEAVAPTKTTVLMTGESGTGKSLVARAIHQRSSVGSGPFVELSCGSIPETLLESELFGHVRGAFTGAHADKRGRFLAANGGTIFLDEINSASPGMQLKLLRVLQERRFEPVGATQTIEVDVRVVLASNQPLEELVADGRFRPDLYYRINVIKIELPPLRERVADIPRLAEHFLEKYCREMNRRIAGFSDETIAALQRYEFPGNVRELENVVERAVVLARQGVIQIGDLPPNLVSNESRLSISGVRGSTDGAEWNGEPLSAAMEVEERRIILAALQANDWNRQQTAQQLQINRTTLYKKMKAYGLDRLSEAG